MPRAVPGLHRVTAISDPPGFAADETQAELGAHLKLPPQRERHRADIERVLPRIRVPAA